MMDQNGYTPSPKQHPRVRPEAQYFAQRNQGNQERWFDYSTGDPESRTPQLKDRLQTDEAHGNMERNKGSMGGILGGGIGSSRGYPDPVLARKLHPRGISNAAADIADADKGRSLKELVENCDLAADEAPVANIKPEGEEYAARNNGTVDALILNYGNGPASPPPGLKVGPGGDAVAERHIEGAGMGEILRMEGENARPQSRSRTLHEESSSSWDELPPARRTRPEAESIHSKQEQGSMSGIMHMEAEPASPRQSKTMPQMTETPTPRPQTSPVRTRPEGWENYQRDRGSAMSAILRMEPEKEAPKKRANRMMVRSEEW